eukprot:TRINITY_DN3639_c0_g1_i2.p2 TRINITY_DN3639_c0_g1~~TRINITY_DN3639_c0_g1_i2.p2  ORF type:complete len:272 (-),score=56.47 TRINITY_DN3639_c0_g1_i2:2226-3041(-)
MLSSVELAPSSASQPPRPSSPASVVDEVKVDRPPTDSGYWQKYFKFTIDKVRGRAYTYNFVHRNVQTAQLKYFEAIKVLPDQFGEEELKRIKKPGPSKVDSPQGILTGFVGAFIGISLCGYLNQVGMQNAGFPVSFLALSFGAASVLLFGKPAAEFSAVRNVFGGQVMSAIVGCTYRAIFHAGFHGNESSWLWLCGGLSVSTAIVVMHVTKTIFPPGGATALAAATIPTMMQWYGYLFVIQPVLTGTLILFSVAIVINNILPERFYPLFWK